MDTGYESVFNSDDHPKRRIHFCALEIPPNTVKNAPVYKRM